SRRREIRKNCQRTASAARADAAVNPQAAAEGEAACARRAAERERRSAAPARASSQRSRSAVRDGLQALATSFMRLFVKQAYHNVRQACQFDPEFEGRTQLVVL